MKKADILKKINESITFDIGDKVIFRDGGGNMHIGKILNINRVQFLRTQQQFKIDYEIHEINDLTGDEYNVRKKNIFKFNEEEAKTITKYRTRWVTY